MSYRLEHIAIYCKDINESIAFYQKYFAGSPTAIRKGAAGYAFCFMKIDGSPQFSSWNHRGQSAFITMALLPTISIRSR